MSVVFQSTNVTDLSFAFFSKKIKKIGKPGQSQTQPLLPVCLQRWGSPLLDAVPRTRLASSSIWAVRLQSADMESTLAGLRHNSDLCGVSYTANRPHHSSRELNNSALGGCGGCRRQSVDRVNGLNLSGIREAIKCMQHCLDTEKEAHGMICGHFNVLTLVCFFHLEKQMMCLCRGVLLTLYSCLFSSYYFFFFFFTRVK